VIRVGAPRDMPLAVGLACGDDISADLRETVAH